MVLYRGIEADAYRLEWMVKQALLILSRYYMLKFDFTPIVIPAASDARTVLRVDDVTFDITRASSVEEIADAIMNALLGPSVLASPHLGMPQPPLSTAAGEASV